MVLIVLRCEGRPLCPATFGPHFETIAGIRKRAAEAGWTCVPARVSRSPRLADDYCPDHKPEGPETNG